VAQDKKRKPGAKVAIETAASITAREAERQHATQRAGTALVEQPATAASAAPVGVAQVSLEAPRLPGKNDHKATPQQGTGNGQSTAARPAAPEARALQPGKSAPAPAVTTAPGAGAKSPAVTVPPPPLPAERSSSPHGVARFRDDELGGERKRSDAKSLDVERPTTLSSPSATAEARRPSPVTPAHAPGPVMEAPPTPHTLGTMPELTRPPMPMPAPAPAPVLAAPPPPPPAMQEPPETKAPEGASSLQPPLLFEIGWEVCWQLGGIYTVLRSKAATTLKTWGDRYCLIGPFNPQTAPVEFEPEEATGAIREALQRLRDSGIPVHFGRWMIAGRPQVILIDYRAAFRELDTDKYLMWADHGISIDNNDGEMNEVVAFGFVVAQFFRELSSLITDRTILAQFHEWMGGVAVPRIAHLRLPISTIFTTHATLLGRYLAGDNPDFYNHLPFLNADYEARKYMIYTRYQVEKAAAHASTVFTTVSEVTSYESEKLLGRRPDVILPNGLNIQRFAAVHEFQNLHRQYKEAIHEFVMGHFFPSYTFDLDRTIYLVTSGRYEYRNKGMDLFIEAMSRLNQRLRYVPDRPTVVAFIITKAPVKHVNIGALQSQTMFDELHRTCIELQEEMGQQLFRAAAQGRVADTKELLTGDAVVRLKRAMHAWRSGQTPAIVTHDLIDDAKDPVLQHLRHRGLFNSGDDPVKMVFHPQFVTPTGPLIHLDYEQFVRGCHMGIFPSYYEPWGYTPMECVALGVPAVTTDLSGFGAYVRRHIPDSNDKGICVLNRRYRGFDEACNELVDYLFDFVRLSRRQRIELRNRVERLSELFDWSALIRHYKEAYELALERSGSMRPGRLEIRMV
jgi:glycogen(starch) synthase